MFMFMSVIFASSFSLVKLIKSYGPYAHQPYLLLVIPQYDLSISLWSIVAGFVKIILALPLRVR